MVEDQDLRREMGQQARVEAEQYHSWQYTAEQIERVFDRVLNER